MAEGAKYRVSSDEYIKVPKNVLEGMRNAGANYMKILLYFLNDESEEPDIKKIATLLSSSEEAVESAFEFWTAAGVLIKNEDIEAAICNKLEIMLKHSPLPYEKQRVIDAITSTQIPLKIALEVIDIGIEEGKISSDWVAEVIKVCAKSRDPEESCNCYRRYFSLMREIIEGLGIEKEFTSKERTMIFEWAKNKIPLEYIFNVAMMTRRRTNNISIPYMHSIIKKAKPEEMFIAELGY